MDIAPKITKTGVDPKYNSAKIPKGIKKPKSANQEICFIWLSLSLNCINKKPITIFKKANKFSCTCATLL